jgi:phosphoglycerol transferase
MTLWRSLSARCGAWIHYPVAVALCLGALVWALRLHNADLRVPFTYRNDAYLVLALIKGHIEHGWYLFNDRLGAPGVYDLRDFPITDLLLLVLLKGLGWIRPDPAAVYNLFTLLTYPLTTVAALAVLRQFNIARVPAVAASLLFTFLPYHYQRLEMGHLFLLAYFQVPLAVLLVLWVCQGRSLFWRLDADSGRYRLHPTGRPALLSLTLAVVLALSGVYYAFFACFLLLVAAALVLLREGNGRAAASAGVLVMVIAGTVVAAGLPTLIYQHHAGPNPETERTAEEADYHGLKVAHLLLPVQQHRSSRLARLRHEYSADPFRPLENENSAASLGLVGAGGFLLLLGCLLAPAGALPPELEHLRVLNVAALLFGLIGGFGSLVSFLVFSQIRCYNRISIFLAFFALFAVAVVASRVFFAPGRARRARLLGGAAVALATAFGIWDQTGRDAAPDHARLAAAYRADAEFGARVEAALPAHAAVFQLPYTRFPEWCGQETMSDYDHLRLHLHSRTLRWSVGAMVNRATDAWQRAVVVRPAPEMVRTLALAGFGGLYLDRHGYTAEESRDLEGQLTGLLGRPAVVSGDGRRVLFDMTAYAVRLREQTSPAAWEQARCDALAIPCALYQDGFYPIRGADHQRAWHYCRRHGRLMLLNPSDRPRQVELSLICRTERREPFPLEIASDFFTRQLSIFDNTPPLTVRFTLPPGRHAVRFTARPPANYLPARPKLVFAVINLSLSAVE